MSLEKILSIWIVSDSNEFETDVRSTLKSNLPVHSYIASSYRKHQDYLNELKKYTPDLIITNEKCKGHYGEKSYDFKPYHLNWVNPETWYMYIEYFAKTKILGKLRRKK